MRAVLDALEDRRMPWYITGSEALAVYGTPRQTMDLDVMVDAPAARLDEIGAALRDAFYYAEPIRSGDRTMAALIDRRGAGKVDLIIRDPDAWAASAMTRRTRWRHPALGEVWVSSLEDLILAKLEWSAGTSELQLRDCRALLRLNSGALDMAYLDAWAGRLEVSELLGRVRVEAADAP